MNAPTEAAGKGRRTIRVDLAGRAYDIAIGAGLIDRAGELAKADAAPHRASSSSATRPAPLYAAPARRRLRRPAVHARHRASRRGSKEFGALRRLMNDLLDHRPDRKTTLVALGGGVVGDLTGFAAAVLLRGVDFIQGPDNPARPGRSRSVAARPASTRHGKNLVGAFTSHASS